MSDLIRREDAIEVADAVWTVTGDKNVAKVWDQIKDLPSVQEQRWIPDTERLPEEFGRYIVTRISADDGVGRVDIIWYSTFYGWERDERPVAWMPLPEPWKGEEDEPDK